MKWFSVRNPLFMVEDRPTLFDEQDADFGGSLGDRVSRYALIFIIFAVVAAFALMLRSH